MKTYTCILLASAAMGVAAPAFAADVLSVTSTKMEAKPDGGYTHKVNAEKVATDGTKTTVKSKVDLDVDANGNKELVSEKVETKDPKGLLNKQVVTTQTKQKLEDGKLIVVNKKTVNGNTVSQSSKTY